MNLKNYPNISKEDLEYFWSDVRFYSGESNPYLEVIERLDLIDNYSIVVKTDNLELYSHISLPKKEMDKENLYYYYLFHFVGQKEGSVLVDGVKVESISRFGDGIGAMIEYDFSRSAILNFTGKERPVLSVDRKNCVSMPKIDRETEQIKERFIEQLVSIIRAHIVKENISITDKLFSFILNIVIQKFPSLADKFLIELSNTPLGTAPIPEHFNVGEKITIKELMTNSDFTLNNINFKKYQEVYRRILVGKLIDVTSVKINNDSMIIEGSNYSE